MDCSLLFARVLLVLILLVTDGDFFVGDTLFVKEHSSLGRFFTGLSFVDVDNLELLRVKRIILVVD